ncbi:TRAP transporter small permease subunit [Granulosicoccus sp. 3-233]|uniref:TRAP transporter small permease subunit n=1 Tax=Granulosicoccus sp. 3-233 TaxID=3417969 RepID=UPI003D32ED2B
MAALLSILAGLGQGFIDLVMLPWTLWQWFHMDVLKERMVAMTLAGMSVQFLYMVLSTVLLLLLLSLISRRFLKSTVLSLEAFNRRIGQLASWFVLLLMMQQVMIIIMGQVFRGNELLFSPFGMQLSNAELQWMSGQLKLYNALLIALASAYTFIEGGHVRVDLVYGNLGYKARRFIDFLGSILFMMPSAILMWWFAWPLAMNSIFAQRPMNIFSDKASWRGVRLETSGTAEFTWVWTFKVLILVFAALLFLQAVAFMLRNLWALLESKAEIESHPVDPTDIAQAEPDINLGSPLPDSSQPDDARQSVRSGDATVAAAAYPDATASANEQLERLRETEHQRRRIRTDSRQSVNLNDNISTPSLAPAGGSNKPSGGQ